MKKITLLLSLLLFSLLTLFSQNNILVIDYNNAFSSDQQNNNSIIYNRLLATQASVVRVNAIPATINPVTYNQVWIFGDMGAPTAANQNPIINYMNVGGAVYIQSEVSCCNNQAAYVDALINATVTVGGSINHTTTLGGYSQTGPSSTACNPPTWVTHSAAVRPFQGTPAANVLLAANATCGAAVPAGTVIGVKFRSCDMISGQGALISIGDFNVFPTAGTCTGVGILGTANDNLVIDYIANLFPSLVTCSNPSGPTMTTPANITVCNGANVPASAFSSTPAGASFAWTNSNSTIGLAASGTGNTPAFTASNTSAAPITATITVTPTLNGCPGPPVTYTITVNPSPVVNPIANITVCNGANVPASAFSSTPAGASFAWTNSNSTIGLAASGTGNTPAFTATNTSGSAVTSTVAVTPTLNGCVGTPVTYTITVNPTPVVNPIANITVCNGANVPASAFSSTPAGASFAWTNSNSTIGLAASGTGNTPAFTATNSSGSAVTSTVAVTPTLNGCVGTPVTYTITVNPTPVVNPIANITVCNGANVPASAFSSTPAGASFAWTNSNSTIGLAASGTGNTPAFTASNTSGSAVTSTVAVTPTLNGCVGTPVTYTITVNPTPVVNPIANITVCNGANVPASAFSSTPAGASFAWTNSNSTIGLAASGTGNTPAFTASNTSGSAVTSTVAVTPTLNGCVGTPVTYTITVNPTPVVNPIANITVCNGANVPASAFSSTPAGASFAWTNSNSTIGLAASGTGNTPAFTATNSSGSAVTSTVAVTPTLNGCVGTPVTYTITVNPTPVVNPITNITVCNGANVPASAFTSTPAGASFAWTNSNSTIGLAASGTGNTPAFTASNTSGSAVTSTVAVTPTLNGCVGTPVTYTITVNPTPSAPTAAGVTICPNNAATLTATAPGGTYEWFDAVTGGNLLATATSYTTPVLTTTASYYVQTTVNGCVSPRTMVTVTVASAIVVNAGVDATICNGDTYNLGVTPNGAGYSYVWDEPGYPGFSTVFNPTVSPTATTTYYVTVTDASNCFGSDSVTITVNPTPVVNPITNITVCNGANVPASAFTSTPAGASFAWTNSNSTIGLAASGSGNTPAFTATNSSGSAVTSTVTVTPTLNGCVGTPVTYTITVNPTPSAPTAAGVTICPNNAATLTATAPGGTYEWFDAATGGNLLATATSYTTPVLTTTASYYVQTTVNGCVSPRTMVTVTVAPGLVVDAGLDTTICYGDAVTLGATPNGTGYSYSWDEPGNLGFSTVFNPTVSPTTTTTYYVTVTDANNCFGSDSVMVTVNPPLSVTMNATNVTCNGACDGVAAVVINGGTAPYTYSWSSGGTTDTETGLCPNLYSVTVTDALGCIVTGDTAITEPAALVLTLNASSNPLCNGACDGNITVTAAGGTGVYQYTIDGINFQASGSFNNLCAGNYVVGVVDDNACVDTVMLTLTDPALLVLDSIVNVDVSCNSANNGNNTDGSISVFATGGTAPLNYSIDNGATFSAANVFSGLSPGSYTVVVEDANGCAVNGGNIVINEPAAISIPNVVTDVSCNGYNDGQIVVAPQGGTPAYSYSWSVNGIGNNPVANNLVAGNVTVTVSDANGCSEAITVTVNQPGPINFIAFSADVLSGCAPLAVEFYNATDTALIDSFYWDLGNGNIAGGDTTATVYSNPGTYDVSLFVTDNNGCPGVLTQTAYIEVFENPTANFSYSPLDVTLFDPLVYFTDLSLFNIASWQWNFANLGASAMQHPNFTFPGEDTASYPVTLLVTNDNGCTDSITKLVKINGETGVFVPNAFTPDGDNLNEFFAPQGFGVSPEGYAFLIFDRWGEVIFESYSPFEGWNGTYKGKIVQNGTYVWKLNYKDTNGKKFQNIGKVNIIK